MTRRPLVLVGIAAALAAGGAAAALVFAVSGDAHRPTRAEYVDSVSVVCQHYGALLDKIPPPVDIASYGNEIASMKPALKILREQAATIRKIDPPHELQAQVDRFFRLTERSIAALAEALRAAERRDIAGLGIGLQRFDRATLAAKKAVHAIGWRC